MRTLLFFALALCCSGYSLSQTYSPYQFLRSNFSARTAGLAEATVAMMDDPSTVVFNPAAIYSVEPGRFSATFQKHVLDINAGNAVYVMKAGSNAKWAVQASYASKGSFNGSDAEGNLTGSSFSAGEVALGVVYANELDSGFYYGAGLSYVNASYVDAGTSALALSAGLLYRIRNSRWNAGLSVTNLGVQLSQINNQSEPLPLDVRLGVNHRLKGLPLLFNFSFHHLAEQNQAFFDHFKNFSIGLELYIGKALQVRGGYNNTLRSSTSFTTQSRMAGISLGAGLVYKDINIDYGSTWLIAGILQHRFSVQMGL